ncbi:2,3-diaminopropionate biosynthesis protein SbnA [Chromobacterium subtsugae]|uniref:2,3-diaminopropionate biosynthesis protein SbnA n=1 Tax=Chromobacterium subtsugae TaxID=251747 RepID=UPI000641115E|nr:2,3-diaminopropionate biosynthesis protein SbnA [Chromobacterium subtsugae]
MRYDSIEQAVSDDIFLRLEQFSPSGDVHLKIEGFNPGGSIKIKTAMALIRDAEERGQLAARKKIIESSSGNLGLALSQIAAARGYDFVCVVDKNTSAQNIGMMRALGTTVVVIEQRDEHNGYLGNRLAYIRQAIARDPERIWLNQYQNPANPAVHADMTARAILNEFGSVDYLFVGAGTTGTLMGCAAFFRGHSPQTRLIAVDSVGSVTFGTPGQARYLPGLGSSVQPHFFDAAAVDRLIQIPEAETIAACRDVALRYGYLGGASTGTVLAAVRRLHAELPTDAVVVAISPDLGNGYLDTVYDDDWCDQRFGPAWRQASQPLNENLTYA